MPELSRECRIMSVFARRSDGGGSANATQKGWRDCRVFQVRFYRTPLVTSKGLYKLQIPWAAGRSSRGFAPVSQQRMVAAAWTMRCTVTAADRVRISHRYIVRAVLSL